MGSRNPPKPPLTDIRAGALIQTANGCLVVKERNPLKINPAHNKMGISRHWKTPGGRCTLFSTEQTEADRTSLEGLLRELKEEGFTADPETFTPAGVYLVITLASWALRSASINILQNP